MIFKVLFGFMAGWVGSNIYNQQEDSAVFKIATSAIIMFMGYKLLKKL